MLHKVISPYELKRADVTTDGRISAYASTFGGPPDLVGDVILQGAFAPAIAAHKSRGTMPAMFLHHNHESPVGVWHSMSEDEHGLLMTGKVSDTSQGKDARILLADGAYSFSIGFRIADGGSKVVGNIRYISKIDYLGEVSLVASPANPKAKLISEGKKCIERILRDAGHSRKSASRYASGYWGDRGCDSQQIHKLARINDAILHLNATIQSTEE